MKKSTNQIYCNFYDEMKKNYIKNMSCATHIGDKAVNQDRVLLNQRIIPDDKSNCVPLTVSTDDFLIIAVADGVSSCVNGAFAAEVILETINDTRGTIEDIYDNNVLSFSEERRLKKWIMEVNNRLIEAYRKEYGGELCAATVSIVIIANEYIYSVNVGDSPILIFRDGELLLLGKIQTIAEEKRRRGDDFLERDRHTLTSYIGDEYLEMYEVYCAKIMTQEKDVILICTDGVTENISYEDLIGAMMEKLDAESIVSKAYNSAKHPADNITAAVIYIDG